jgi:hypothetical protein
VGGGADVGHVGVVDVVLVADQPCEDVSFKLDLANPFEAW